MLYVLLLTGAIFTPTLPMVVVAKPMELTICMVEAGKRQRQVKNLNYYCYPAATIK